MMETTIKTYQTFLEGKYSPRTINIYLHELKTYLSNHPAAADYNQPEILAYIEQQRQTGKGPGTLRRILIGLKSWYRFLLLSGYRSDNPVRFLSLRDPMSNDIQLQDLLDESELGLLMEKAFGHRPVDIRNRLLVSLLVYQGLRLKEVIALKLKDIDMDRRKIKIKKQAQTNGRVLYFQGEQPTYFEDYFKGAREKLLKGKTSEYLLINHYGTPLRKEGAGLCISKGFKDYIPGKQITAGVIRQSVISNMLIKGHDLRVVQVFAGHQNVQTTARYSQENVYELQREIEKYHPLK